MVAAKCEVHLGLHCVQPHGRSRACAALLRWPRRLELALSCLWSCWRMAQPVIHIASDAERWEWRPHGSPDININVNIKDKNSGPYKADGWAIDRPLVLDLYASPYRKSLSYYYY